MAAPGQEAFLQWLADAGGLLHSQLNLFADTGATGRGVQALASIPKGEQLAKIPLDCCLHIRHQVCMPMLPWRCTIMQQSLSTVV